MSLSAPYNFVPLSRFILRPDWAEQANHDHPFADGLSGELSFTLRAHTPLCVGGAQSASSPEAPGQVHFYRTPDGVPAIPGSSLKGMLRSVTEIATFGHFRQVEDRRLGVRDFSKSGNFYFDYIKEPQAGWLTYRDGNWLLTPCKFVRLHQQALIDQFEIDEATWVKNNTVVDRYTLIGGLKSVKFSQEPHKDHPTGIATALGYGEFDGTVVVSGQPGPHFKANKSAKKWEYVFYQPSKEVPVSADLLADFQFIHGESAEWAYWRKQLGSLSSGVPVFFHRKSDGELRSLGLSMVYKVAYEHSLHQAVAHTQSAHLDADNLDMASLLFGHMSAGDNTRQGDLRGRVNIGMAFSDDPSVESRFTAPTVLSSPKANFYPAYIRQPKNEGKYNTLMDAHAELSGWKRYPVKPMNVQTPPKGSRSTVQVQLETLPIDSSFSGKLRFHNLRPVELGALLWSIDFGARDSCRHSLGTGKPYGLGQVSLQIDCAESLLRANDPAMAIADTESLLAGCRYAFDDYIQTAWSSAVQGGEDRWDESQPLVQLLAMADPYASQGRDDLSYLTEPNLFSNAKNAGLRLEPYHGAKDKSLILEPDFNYTPTVSGSSLSLTEAVDRAESDKAKKAIEAQQVRENFLRGQAKAKMSTEERELEDIKDVLAKPEPKSKTDIKTLEKLYRSSMETLDSSHELAPQLLLLTEAGDKLDNKLITKICKKIRVKFSD